jgi:rRNA maturation RNase YbeY
LDKKIGNIHIALMDDDDLLELNQKHLDLNDYTDVITFDYSTANEVNCDIAVSTDRVSENATHVGESVENELARVLIHGILHCVGYSDKTVKDKQIMREKEDEMLKQFHVEHKLL